MHTPPQYQNWRTSQTSAQSDRGIVCTQHSDASRAGMQMLKNGGNAMDAAIAAAFALSVCEPWASGLGGGGFCNYYCSSSKKVSCVTFQTPAPMKLDYRDMTIVDGHTSDIFSWPSVSSDHNRYGPKSVAIPGAVAGYSQCLEAFGQCRWSDVLAPAINLADQGHLVTWWSTIKIAEHASILRQFKGSATDWLPAGLPACMSEELKHRYLDRTRLAQTLRRLQSEGADSFYTGHTADLLLHDIQKAGGYWTETDLSSYHAHSSHSKQLTRGDYHYFAPVGFNASESFFKIMNNIPIYNGPMRHDVDPDHYHDIATSLISESKLRLMREGHLANEVHNSPSSTSHITVRDVAGNVACLTTTLLSIFGSKYTSPSTGILLNNGLYWFYPTTQHHPNAMRQGAFPLTNMLPVIMTKGDQFFCALGASGGRRILPAVTQLALLVSDYSMSLEAAFSTDRIDTSELERIVVPSSLSATSKDRLSCVAPLYEWPDTINPSPYGIANGILTNASGSTGCVSQHLPLVSALGL
ncbi:MAG: gamma-glutamyltransferase [Pseudomonadota bacterium]|nr:gamma-glutamyltransferase [Pseudomonadota bacterium]